jgi:hypothetical protein
MARDSGTNHDRGSSQCSIAAVEDLHWWESLGMEQDLEQKFYLQLEM